MDSTAAVLQQMKNSDLINDVRERALTLCKDFKVNWLKLGQTLYAVSEDKLYNAWGYETFEDYTKKELGFDKGQALKMLKSYLHAVDQEPQYLADDFASTRETRQVPSLDEINLLRLAKGKKELFPEDYNKLRQKIFEKGTIAAAVRKDLTAMIRERKDVDPEEERNERARKCLKTLIHSLKTFRDDMEASKLVPHELVEEASTFMEKLKAQGGV